MNKLDAFLEVFNMLPTMFAEDVALTLFNTSEIVAYHPGKSLDTGAKIGDRPNPNSNVIEALTKGERVVRKVPKEVFGVPFVGIANPIKDQGVIIGCIAVASSIERQQSLINAGEAILDYARRISDIAQGFSAGSEELASTIGNLNQETDRVREEMEQTNSVTEHINSISMQSKILGLNATIEASRAGELGRGFSVVAEEIRKLAENTKKSTKEIKDNLTQAQLSVNMLVTAIKELGVIAETQAMGAAEIADALKQVEKMAHDLVVAGEVQH